MTKQEKQEQAVKLATLRLMLTKHDAKIGALMAVNREMSGMAKTEHAIGIAQECVRLAEIRHDLECAKAGNVPPAQA